MGGKNRWLSSERHKLRRKYARRNKDETHTDLPGPKGSRYFYSYSENMIGRAVEDANLLVFRGANYSDKIISVTFPDVPNDLSGKYGIMYLPSHAIRSIVKFEKDFVFRKLARCEIQSLDERLIFLQETKEAEIVRGWFQGESYVPKGLLGTGFRLNDLGFYLYGILDPLLGVVYRHGKNNDVLLEVFDKLGYVRTNFIEGISESRFGAATFFGKPARNINPHTISVYSRPSQTELGEEKMKQLSSGFI